MLGGPQLSQQHRVEGLPKNSVPRPVSQQLGTICRARRSVVHMGGNRVDPQRCGVAYANTVPCCPSDTGRRKAKSPCG